MPRTPRKFSPLRRWAVLPAVAALALTGFTAAAESAAAYRYLPSVPTGMRVTATGHNAFTVALRRATHAKRYEVIASTVRSDVYISNIYKASRHRRHAIARSPRVTITGLPYSTGPYYYRVAAINGSRYRWSRTYPAVYLRPSTPTRLAASTSGGVRLAWSHGAAAGFRIEQASDARFTRSVRVYRVRANVGHFAPYATSRGHGYYFRVRAANGRTYSSWTAPVHVAAASGHVALRVATYNSLSTVFDGHTESGSRVAPWSQRRSGQVSLLQGINAGLIGIEEAGSYVNAATRTRQIDSIRSGLGSKYRIVDGGPGPDGTHKSVDSFVLYQPSLVTPVGGGGHWQVDTGRLATYQAFRSVSTSAKFLFAVVHLLPTRGRSYDQVRKRETAALVSSANKYAVAHGISSIVLVGDFNAYPGRRGATDTPGQVMSGYQLSDSLPTAQSVRNSSYNSINEYRRTPPRNGGSVDRVFTSRGVGVASWTESLHLSHGKFVGAIPSDHNPVSSVIELPY
jgi:hypothetical protein